MRSLSDILDEYEFLEGDERYRLLIELGRELEPMPEALKTDATLVRGCSAAVWVYPTQDDEKLHFLADSNAAITKGIVALVLSAVQDKPAAEVAAMDVAAALAPFYPRNQLSSHPAPRTPTQPPARCLCSSAFSFAGARAMTNPKLTPPSLETVAWWSLCAC